MPRPPITCAHCADSIGRRQEVRWNGRRYHRSCALEVGWKPPAIGRPATARGAKGRSTLVRFSESEWTQLKAEATSHGHSIPQVIRAKIWPARDGEPLDE